MFSIDQSNEFGVRAVRRLNEEAVGWLTTVDRRNSPKPSMIWFLWDGETLLIYSKPNTPKVRNIEANSLVSFNLNGDRNGNDLIILQGEARIDNRSPSAKDHPAYVAKYTEGVKSIDMTWESFAGEYSTPIRITPTSIRGF